MTPQQRAVERLGALYERFEVEPPPPSLLVQWVNRCAGQLPAVEERLEEVMLAGRLQEAEQPTAFAAKCIQSLAQELRTGRWVSRRGNGHSPDPGPRKAALRAMEGVLHAASEERAEVARGELRRLCEQLGWPFAEPTAETVSALAAELYPGGEETE